MADLKINNLPFIAPRYVNQATEDAVSTTADAVNSVAPGVIKKSASDFSAWPIVGLMLRKEAVESQRLHESSAKMKEEFADIDTLLELNKELTSWPEQDSYTVNDTARGLLTKLQKHDIQVWQGKESISKAELGAMKAQIGAQIDQIRTKSQREISTEMQPRINALQAIINIVQKILDSVSRLISKTNERIR